MSSLKYVTRFIVRGGSQFPIDMLRYDACFPRSETDANMIANTFGRDLGGPVEVELTKYHELAFHARLTPDRWKSFLWQIDAATIRTEKLP